MHKLLRWLFPEYFFGNPAYFRAVTLAFLYVGLLLAQLFTYEKFTDVTYGFGLPGGMATAWAVAVLIPLLELAALPYLISMQTGKRLYRVSRGAVVAVPVLWIGLIAWQLVAESASKLNSGLFGATLMTQVGPWLLLFSLLMAWAAILVVRELPRPRLPKSR